MVSRKGIYFSVMHVLARFSDTYIRTEISGRFMSPGMCNEIYRVIRFRSGTNVLDVKQIPKARFLIQK